MAKKTRTHIIGILDRSGSMASLVDDAIGGFNTLVEEQAAQPGKCTVTLAQFDHVYEVVYEHVKAADVEPRSRSNFVPRGRTALLDAVGQTVNGERARLAALPAKKQPDLVVVVIVTDGHENVSREWDRARVKALLGTVEKGGWQVLYLGANQDAFSVAGDLGISGQNVANYAGTGIGTRAAYSGTSGRVSRMRGAVASGKSAADVGYTSAERDSMAGE